MNRHRYPELAAAMLLSLVNVWAAADAPEQSDPPNQAQVSKAPALPGVAADRATRVFRNPETGVIEFAPAASNEAPGLSVAEQNMLSRSDEGLQARVLPNGAVAVNLQGRFQSMATAYVDQGSDQAQVSCSIDDPEHMDHTTISGAAE